MGSPLRPSTFIVGTLFLCSGIFLQSSRVVKRPTSIDKFHFLVPQDASIIQIKTSVETVQYDLKLNLSEASWDVLAEEFLLLFKKFENLTFLESDLEFRNEVTSQIGPGFLDQKGFFSNMNDIIKYLTQDPDIEMAPCRRTISELDPADIKRGLANLQFKFEKINGNWPVGELKQDLTKLNTLFSFISTYNGIFNELEEDSYRVLQGIEALSDGLFPELLHTNKTCGVDKGNNVKVTEGETYEVERCMGTQVGFSCLVTIRQPIQLASVTRLSKVNYRGIEIMGEGPNWLFARQSDTELTEQLLCDSDKSPHPSCCILDIEEGCRNALNNNVVKDIIYKCNFTKNPYPEPFHKVADGGILILQANAVSSGETLLTNQPPFIIYSPATIGLTLDGEEFLIIPSKQIDTLNVVDSILSDTDIDLLESEHFEDWIGEIDNEDWINIGLGTTQLLFLPLTIWGICLACKQRGKIGELMEMVEGPSKKTIYKRNYRKVRAK
jgi:hypothetical protein